MDITLVTGSTGYVGAFIVRYILATTQSDVLCLVRGEEEPRQRLLQHFKEFGLDIDPYLSRLRVIAGDITQEKLGFSAQEYEALANTVTHVIHCAAWTNHLRPYRDLAPTNVDSVKHFIAFCFAGRKKAFSFVSSLGSVVTLTEKGELSEEFPREAPGVALPPSGYGLTKYRAEQLIEQAIRDGLHCKVVRLGQMTGDSQTGNGVRWDDHLMLQLKECVLSGYAADWPGEKRAFMPCDYAAKIIVTLTFGEDIASGSYNLSYEAMSWRDVIAYLNELGYCIKLVPPKQWMEVCKRRGDACLLHVLLPHYAEDGKLTRQFPFIDQITSGGIDDRKTKAALSQLGVTFATPSPRKLLERYVAYFIRDGFFPPISYNP
jgi:thioester reductase-like protein